MLPTVCIVGRSNAGKTTAMERLVRELKTRGFRVASVKRSSHPFDIDYEGKDSWRLAQAGSDAVILTSSELCVHLVRQQRYPTLDEIILSLGDGYDILLVEGYKDSAAPKIEVYNPSHPDGFVCKPEGLMGIITPQPLDLPVWQCHPDDTSALADFVQERIIEQRDETPDISLMVNDAPVRLNIFAKKVLSGMLFAFVNTLSGVTFPRKIALKLRIGE